MGCARPPAPRGPLNHGIIPALPTHDHAVSSSFRDSRRLCPVNRSKPPRSAAQAAGGAARQSRPSNEVRRPTASRAAALIACVMLCAACASRGGQTAAPWSGDLRLARTVALESSASAGAALLERVVYVPLRDGRVTSVSLDTGRIGWTIDLAATGALAAGDGLVFAATADALVAIGTDGSRRWSVAVPGGFSAPPVWESGWLVAPTAGGEVLGLRAQDGHLLWTARAPAPAIAPPAIGVDRVFLALDDGHVVALDLKSGAQLWQRKLDGRPGAPLAAADRVFLGASDRWFYCLSAEDGGREWRWRHGGLITAAPAVDARHVYLAGFNNVLRALDRDGGSQRWMKGLPLRPIGGPMVLDDLVLVAGIGGEIHTFRGRIGEPAGQFTGSGDLAAPPLLVPHPVPELIALVLVTRGGELQVLSRPLGVAIVPLREVVGVRVPLGAPPAPP